MTLIKILMAHNYYRIHGGEEESFRAEKNLLEHMGHEVFTYTRSNDEIQTTGINNKSRLFLDTIWAKDSYHAIVRLIRRHQPDLVHFQNTFPLISPSAYYACKTEGIPVVQSLRSYRLICSNGFFYRDGKICEDCMGKALPFPAVIHACYRNSRLQSSAVVSMLSYHRAIRTWKTQVDLYIALTEFSRDKFIQSGLPPEKIIVKPNYIPDPGIGVYPGDYAIYVGRLSSEKGIMTVLEAWKEVRNIPLKIVGDGPMAKTIQSFIETHQISAEMLGRFENKRALEVIKRSAFLVFSSLLYETFGRTIVEAFACGKPVIASHHGTSTELIEDGKTGLFFLPGNPRDLRRKVNILWNSPELRVQMGKNARNVYKEKYTRDQNYARLAEIYREAIKVKI